MPYKDQDQLLQYEPRMNRLFGKEKKVVLFMNTV